MPLPENDDDVTLLQDAVMKEVELKHQQERELLMAVSGVCLFSQGAPYGCEWCLFVQSGSSLWL